MKTKLPYLVLACFAVMAVFTADIAEATSHLVTNPGGTRPQSIQEFIAATLIFLNNVVVPLLFAIALLIFLVNATRFFILGSSNNIEREKARRLALWGILAFVFLVSLWGIVNSIVGGLGFNRDASFCPDYLPGTYCGDIGSNSPGTGGGSYTPGYAGGTSGYDGATGGYSGGGITPSPTDDTSTASGIATLVYGANRDTAIANFVTGAPRAAGGTPFIDSSATCPIGMQTLQLAAEVEQNQTAYVFYRDGGGNYQWTNITDITYANGVEYDSDTINDLEASGATDLYLIHTHQREYVEDAGYGGSGSFPSESDMLMTCDSVFRDMTHVVVDWNHVWIMDQPDGVCPRNSALTDGYPTAEALALIAQSEAGTRNQEFFDLYNAPTLQADNVRDLNAYVNTDFDTMSESQILDEAVSLLPSNLNLSRTSISGFCNNV